MKTRNKEYKAKRGCIKKRNMLRGRHEIKNVKPRGDALKKK